MIEIRHRYTGAILLTADADTLAGANLTCAKLTCANLYGANLTDANLTGADLTGAKLTGADLRDADLTGAKLTGADLRDADLTGAELRDAKLPGFPGQLPASYAEAVEALIAWLTPLRWLKSAWVATPDGAYSGSCKACLHGAAAYIGGPDHGPRMTAALNTKGYGVQWNDDPDRTYADIRAAMESLRA